MQRCDASRMTKIPLGFKILSSSEQILAVSDSWTLRRFERVSMMRGTLERPMILPLGM